VVDSLDSPDFNEGKKLIDKVTEEIILKKENIVRDIRSKYE
jgi:hypothetical protein